MNWTGILAGLGGLFLAWPSIKPQLAKLPLVGKIAGTLPAATDPKPECFTNPAAKPPAWVPEWVELVRGEAGGLGDEFICECLKGGCSLFDVARIARDRKKPGGKL